MSLHVHTTTSARSICRHWHPPLRLAVPGDEFETKQGTRWTVESTNSGAATVRALQVEACLVILPITAIRVLPC